MYAGAMAAVPLLVMACVYLALDPFKVLRWHDNPFDDLLGLNKGMLSVQAYARDVAGQKYDSFIMGSSVSCAYPVREKAVLNVVAMKRCSPVVKPTVPFRHQLLVYPCIIHDRLWTEYRHIGALLPAPCEFIYKQGREIAEIGEPAEISVME